MKRTHLIFIFAVFLLVGSLTGCTGENAETVPETTTATSVPVETEAAETAERVVLDFAKAYFAGDADTLCQYLSGSYDGDEEVYGENGSDVVIHAVKGLENAEEAERGTASVEFKTSEAADYYGYLTIEMSKEQGQWKVSFYALEG